MTKFKYYALLFLLLFCFGAGGWQSGERTSATVEITTITQAEESADKSISDLSQQGVSVVDLIQRYTNKSFQANFRGLRGSNIPYGDYILRLSVPGFRKYEQTLRVYQPSVSVRIGLIVSLNVDAPIPIAKGAIRPISKDTASLWVKLMPVTNNSSLMESRVQADGSFRLAGFDPGEYLLVVVRGTTIIHSRQVSLLKDVNDVDVLLTK
jgi:hypothetical protein